LPGDWRVISLELGEVSLRSNSCSILRRTFVIDAGLHCVSEARFLAFQVKELAQDFAIRRASSWLLMPSSSGIFFAQAGEGGRV